MSNHCVDNLVSELTTLSLLLSPWYFNGNSEIGAPVWSDLGYLICLRHLFRSRVVTHLKLISGKTCFLHKCAKCSEFSSNINTIFIYWYVHIKNINKKMNYCICDVTQAKPLYLFKRNLVSYCWSWKSCSQRICQKMCPTFKFETNAAQNTQVNKTYTYNVMKIFYR